MATYFARSNGNVNAAIWATTASGAASDLFPSFTSGDVLLSNSFTVTINVNLNLGSTGEIRNDTTGGATSGGGFTMSTTGVTLTANLFAGATAPLVTTSGSAVVTIVGNINAGSGATANGVNHNSNGLLTVIGAVTGGSVGGYFGIAAGSGPVNITGNVTGGLGPNAHGLYMNSNGTTYNITGNVMAGAGNFAGGVGIGSVSTLNIIGTLSGSSTSTGIRTIVVSVITLNVVGTCVGSGNVGMPAIGNGSTITITRAKGGPLVGSTVGVNASASDTVTVDEIEYGDLGASPTSGPIRFANKTSNVAVMYRFGTTKKTLVDSASTSLLPSASNVRSGTIYNAGQSTGTCSIPPANSVASGVPVDNTVGTATLTAADFWNYLASNINTSGSVGERLVNCSTVSSVSQQLAGAL